MPLDLSFLFASPARRDANDKKPAREDGGRCYLCRAPLRVNVRTAFLHVHRGGAVAVNEDDSAEVLAGLGGEPADLGLKPIGSECFRAHPATLRGFAKTQAAWTFGSTIAAVLKALAAGERAARESRDGGSANLDSPVLVLDKKDVGLMAALAGRGVETRWVHGWGLFLPDRSGGQAGKRTAYAETVRRVLHDHGVPAAVYYKVD